MEPRIENTAEVNMDKVPPQAVESERAVLGALMQVGDDNEAFFEIQSEISASSFYHKKHRKVFSACAALIAQQKPIDMVTVAEQLIDSKGLDTIGGVNFLEELIDSCPTTANIKFYAAKVREAAIRRYLIMQSAKTAAMADDQLTDIDEVIAATEAAIMTIRESQSNDHLVDIKTAVNATLKRIQKLYDTGEAIIGLPTGFHALDLKLSGMQPGQYIVVAGRPGMGKSVLIQNIIKSVALDQKKGVALFTVETSWESFTMRLVAQVSGQNFQALRTGHVGDWSALTAGIARLTEARLCIDSSGGIKPSEIRGKLRQIQRKIDIDLIVVDYMQLMAPSEPQRDRRLAIESISSDLKALAQEFRCPILVCSQLSRQCETRPDHRPQLSDLRESGAIEQDADVVLGLYRGWMYDKKIDPKHTELIILKNKDGPPGMVHMNFDMGVMEFTEVS